MHEAVYPLAAWEAFYVIIGSSAAALTGLQFVVIVLGAEANVSTDSTTRAFGTPTIVHFSTVLLVSAILSAPWNALWYPAVGLGACGAAGIVYGMMVLRRMRRQTEYVPVLEDWLWYGTLPFVGHVALVTAAVALTGRPAPSLFIVGGSAVFLLFIGIHNAWDAVTYIAHTRVRKREPPDTA